MQHTQQFGLQLNRHLANFIQKNGAALGLLEQTFVLFVGAGECALFVSKKHVFNQMLGQSCTVHGDKWAFGSQRGFVQHTGQYFFTGTCGAHQQSGNFSLCNALGQGKQMLADGVDKHIAFAFDIGGEQTVHCDTPASGVPLIAGQHMQCTQAHSVDCDFHAATLYAAHHRDGTTELGNQGQDFFEQVCAVTESDDQHMRFAQGQVQLAHGRDLLRFDVRLRKLLSIGIGQWTERVQPNSFD